MYLLLLALALPNCTIPRIDNRTDTWTAVDLQSYESAITRCSTKYPNSPCLKRFIKVDTNRYFAICGKNQ